MYICKNLCELSGFGKQVLEIVFPTFKGGVYNFGIKRCQECEYYCATKLLSCPCCGRKFKTKPRGQKKKRLSKSEGDKYNANGGSD